MDIDKQMAARVCTLVAEGVSPDVAALQVIGDVNHPAVNVIEQLQRTEGLDYSRTILKVAAKGLEGHRLAPEPDYLGFDLDSVQETLSQVSRQLDTERDLTCALGVALRQVLPHAEQEVNSLEDDADCDRDSGTAEIAAEGRRSLQRARIVLKKLDQTHLSVRDFKDDHFDESFNIKFED
ncbi:hypothetical protein [Xanthomonas phage RTH11]|nr:hypothetical protein [Xanthomonas phage RTH11]